MLIAAPLLSAFGFVLMTTMTPTSPYPWVAFVGSVTTAGMGLAFAPIARVATEHVGESDVGVASGLLNTSQQVGGAVGLAVMATLAAAVTQRVTSTTDAPVVGLYAGFQVAFVLGAALSVAAAGASLTLPRSARPTGSRIIVGPEPSPSLG